MVKLWLIEQAIIHFSILIFVISAFCFETIITIERVIRFRRTAWICRFRTTVFLNKRFIRPFFFNYCSLIIADTWANLQIVAGFNNWYQKLSLFLNCSGKNAFHMLNGCFVEESSQKDLSTVFYQTCETKNYSHVFQMSFACWVFLEHCFTVNFFEYSILENFKNDVLRMGFDHIDFHFRQ